MADLKYKRVLLKLSGEALAGQKGTGFDFNVLQRLATEVSTYVLQTLGQPAIAEGNTILIRDFKLGIVEALDRGSDGLPLPFWEGCVRLFEGQFFVIQPIL